MVWIAIGEKLFETILWSEIIYMQKIIIKNKIELVY